MSRSRIINGVWERDVPWQHGAEWRSDIFKSTLADDRLETAKFFLSDGPTVTIPAEELRRVLVGGRDHYAGKIWGPFNINPVNSTVDGKEVFMDLAN